MAKVTFARRALDDLERAQDLLAATGAPAARKVTQDILQALTLLTRHPFVGRPREDDFRELVISRGSTGFVALYEYDERLDVVRILRVRHQREAGFEDAE